MANQIEAKDIVYKALSELALSEAEVELYALSLSLGPSSITEIAKHLKVSRPNVYKLISGLKQAGLASFGEDKKYSRNFVVEPPTAVLEKVRQKREAVAKVDQHLAAAMPDLLAHYRQGAAGSRVRVLEGVDQYLNILNQSLEEEKDSIEFFGAEADFVYFVNKEDEAAWFRKRVRKGVKLRMLLLPSADAQALLPNTEEGLREVRILKDAMPFVGAFQIFANKVVMWQPKAPSALLIEDAHLVAMMKSVFYALWNRMV